MEWRRGIGWSIAGALVEEGVAGAVGVSVAGALGGLGIAWTLVELGIVGALVGVELEHWLRHRRGVGFEMSLWLMFFACSQSTLFV